MDDSDCSKYFPDETENEKPPPSEKGPQLFHLDNYSSAERKVLKKILNERLKWLETHYGKANVLEHFGRGKIENRTLDKLVSEYEGELGHSVEDEMSIRRGLAVKLPEGIDRNTHCFMGLSSGRLLQPTP